MTRVTLIPAIFFRKSPVLKTCGLIVLIVGFLDVSGGHADVGQWTTFTNTKDVRQFVIRDSTIWAATNGGLLRYSIPNDTFSVYTNTDGLEGNDLSAIDVDQRGIVWLAGSKGEFFAMNPETGEIQGNTAYRDQDIRDLYTYGDSVFVVLGIGVSLFDASRWEVKETWHIGASNQVAIIEDSIWVATENGIKRAYLDFPNLMAPSAWTTFGLGDGLPTSTIHFVKVLAGQVYAGTSEGLTVWHERRWQDTGLGTRNVFDADIFQDQVVSATTGGIYQSREDGAWYRLGDYVAQPTQVTTDDVNTLWTSPHQRCLARFRTEYQDWQEVEANGPVSNRFSDLTIDAQGRLWAASQNPNGGLSWLDGNRWYTFAHRLGDGEGSSRNDDYRTIAVDSSNTVWAGSWGSGITILTPSADSFRVSYIDNTNGYLSGVSENDNYVVTNKLKIDDRQFVWILNYSADDLRILAAVDPWDWQWTYFSTLDGFPSLKPTALEIDHLGRKWVGFFGSGIKVLDDNGTPFDPGDDDLSLDLNTQEGLENNQINALAIDQDEVMWIGTPEGLNFWFQSKVGTRYSVINDYINTIIVDPQNNKWFGTRGGLSRLDSDGFTWEHFSTFNSPIVSDNIISLAFDEETGYLYVGTTEGLSRLETPYTRPAQDLSEVSGYPNPFVLDGQIDRFVVDNLTSRSTVRFFSPSGTLVRHIHSVEIAGSSAIWDGRNDRGMKVASGVYVYVVTIEDGESFVGKVAVINP